MWWTSVVTWIVGKAWPFLWDRFKHLAVYIAIIVIFALVVSKFHNWKDTYGNIRYQQGYKQCGIDHPSTTVQAGGTSNTYISSGDKLKSAGIEIDGFGFGFWHRRQS